jgi:hypothetical protein
MNISTAEKYEEKIKIDKCVTHTGQPEKDTKERSIFT